MQAEYRDLELLMEMQQLDLDIMRAKKKRVELHQRIQVMMLRKKRDEIQGKLEQVVELAKRANVEKTSVEDEDRLLAEKQEHAQQLIDAAGSNYRKVESHSREMAGAAKRREALAIKIQEADAQIAKIAAVRSQLENAIAASEAEEAEIRASFQEEDNALVSQVRASSARRAEIESQLPSDLVALYDKTASKVGTVALGRLVEDRCGVCRAPIEGGRLIDLKASAPLGTCPNCKRLLVIYEDQN